MFFRAGNIKYYKLTLEHKMKLPQEWDSLIMKFFVITAITPS